MANDNGHRIATILRYSGKRKHEKRRKQAISAPVVTVVGLAAVVDTINQMSHQT